MSFFLHPLEELSDYCHHGGHGDGVAPLNHTQTIPGNLLYRHRARPDVIKYEVYANFSEGNQKRKITSLSVNPSIPEKTLPVTFGDVAVA